MSFPMVTLREVVQPVERAEVPTTGTIYRQVGVKLWGVGAYERESIDGSQTKYKTLSRVETDDIIVNKIWARNGSVAVIPKNLAGCYVSTEFPTFVPIREKLDPSWFRWLTKTKFFWEKCDEKSQGTSGKNRIRPERFLEIEIPLPPLPEQRRIVAHIEKLATKIEEALGLRKKAEEGAEALKNSLTQNVFETVEKQSSIHERLDTVVRILGGGTPSKNNFAFWNGKIPWVSPKDMKSPDIIDSQDHITEAAIYSSSTTLIPENSVLVVVRSGILQRTIPVAINRVQVTINQDMKALLPNSGLIPEYLRWWFKGKEPQLLEYVKGGTTVQSLVWEKVKTFGISIPPLPEQRRIVAYLDNLQAKADALRCLQAETSAELDALMPAILDRAFKGEL